MLTGVQVASVRLWEICHVFKLPSSRWSVLWMVHDAIQVSYAVVSESTMLNYFDVWVRLHFYDFYCVLLHIFYLFCLSACLCVCVWACVLEQRFLRIYLEWFILHLYTSTFYMELKFMQILLLIIFVLNSKLLRILQYKSIKSHSMDLYKTYSTLPIQLLHNYQILIFIHKYVYNKDKLPSVFSNCFEENSLFHCYDTRQKDHFHTYSVLVWSW